jgi:acyl-CoA thioesterase-1
MLVIETGANDALRGQNVDSTKANIQAIIDRAKHQEPRPRIALVQMRALPNYGFGYARRFREMYPALAKANDILLVPFLLEGVAGREGMNQADMMHPTAAGQRKVAETVWRAIGGVLSD